MADKHAAAQDDINAAQNAVKTIDDEIAKLNDEIGQHRGEILTLQERIEQLKAQKDEDEAFLKIVEMRAQGKSLRALIAPPATAKGSRKPREAGAAPRGPRVGNGVRSDPDAIREAVRGFLEVDEALTPAAIIERLAIKEVVLSGENDKSRMRNLKNALIERNDNKGEFKFEDGRYVMG